MGFWVWVLCFGFRVWGLGFGVWSLGFRFLGFGFWVLGFGFGFGFAFALFIFVRGSASASHVTRPTHPTQTSASGACTWRCCAPQPLHLLAPLQQAAAAANDAHGGVVWDAVHTPFK